MWVDCIYLFSHHYYHIIIVVFVEVNVKRICFAEELWKLVVMLLLLLLVVVIVCSDMYYLIFDYFMNIEYTD